MNRGLYPAPDEEPPVGESPAAASLPRADAPLKGCPWCNSAPVIHHDIRAERSNQGGGYWYVGCENHNCDFNPGEYAGDPEECAKEWNRRDGEDARIAEAVAKARREALEEAIELIARIESIRDE